MENNSLTKPIKMGSLKKGLAANREAYNEKMKSIDPTTVPNRLGVVMDDSISMGHDGMEKSHQAIKGFTNTCNPLDTSITIYPMNEKEKPLTCDYDLLNMFVVGIWANGGTPTYGTLERMYKTENITRGILFSDGEPTDSSVLADKKREETNDDFWYGKKTNELAMKVVGLANEKKAPIDTIYIGYSKEDKGYREMEELARLTGGTCIHFKDAASLSSGLKYLAPKYRALLANPDIKARIERGESV